MTTILKPNLFKANENSEEHSKELDTYLGLDIDSVEKKLITKVRKINQHLNSRTWIGLDGQLLNTPYGELYEMVMSLAPYNIESIADLGAGYGRVGIVFSSFFPEVKFTGYEFIEERVQAGNEVFYRLGLKNCQLCRRDILEDFELPSVQLYFIYDFSNIQVLKVVLSKLSDKMFERRFFVIVRGKAVRSMVEHHFPSFGAQGDAVHRENWSLYKSL